MHSKSPALESAGHIVVWHKGHGNVIGSIAESLIDRNLLDLASRTEDVKIDKLWIGHKGIVVVTTLDVLLLELDYILQGE